MFLIVVCLLFLSSCGVSSHRVIQTKDWAEIFVDDEFDYNYMLNPPDKYKQILQIDKTLRADIAEYMENNNYRLKFGKQDFIRINPTYEWLIYDTDGYGFVFEEMVK